MLEQTGLVSLTEGMPELRASQYAKVVEWDASRMALEGQYEAADGEYLVKIRDALKSTKHGLWTAYLAFRNLPYQTANDRIRKAENRPHLHAPIPRDSLGISGPQYPPVNVVPSEPIYAVRDWTTGVYDQDEDDEPQEVMPERGVVVSQGSPMVELLAERQRETEEFKNTWALTDNLARALEIFDAGNRSHERRLQDFDRADASVLSYRAEFTARRVRNIATLLLAWAERLEEREMYASKTA